MFLPGENSAVEYDGPRDSRGIVRYLKGKMGENPRMRTLEELEVYRKKYGSEPLLVGVFPEGSDMSSWYRAVARNL